MVLRDGEIISTHVKSFHYEAEAYWFRINAVFLPDDLQTPAINLVLYRLYEDFYNFQITLLDLFPTEAGRNNNRNSTGSGTIGSPQAERILPYMPGPLEKVDVDVTNNRREDLDIYLRELLNLRGIGAGYILRHEHVLGFFTPGAGDTREKISRIEAEGIALETEAAAVEVMKNRLSNGGSIGSVGNMQRMSRLSGLTGSGGGSAGIEEKMEGLNVARFSTGTGESGERGSPLTPSEQAFFGSGSGGGATNNKANYASSRLSAHTDTSRSASPLHNPNTAASGNKVSPPIGGKAGLPFSPGITSASTSSSFGGGAPRFSGNNGNIPLPTPSSTSSAITPSAPIQPPHNANSSLPPFIKIKILDRNTDDMIAIRVPPLVTYEQLWEKVRDRLVSGLTRLQYRTSLSGPGGVAGKGEFVDITDERSLREWLEREEKLILYAE